MIQGTLGGNTVTVRQAVFRQPVMGDRPVIYLSTDSQLCEHLKARVEAGAGLFFNLKNAAGKVTAGSYAVLDDLKERQGINQNLGPLTAWSWGASGGKSGAVKLDSFDDSATGSATGSFEIAYLNGDKVTGVFSASACVFP